jgi:predicted O-methyltransferase YrrM
MRNTDDYISLKDQFLETTCKFTDQVRHLLRLAKSNSDTLGKTGISISYYEADLINFFIRQTHCKKFVEFGTLTGFSSVSILSALQSAGELWTFEKDEVHASMAQKLFDQIDYSLADFENKKLNLIVGDATEKMNDINKIGPFDGVFIDGNKSAYLKYLHWAMDNIRSGGLIIADNVFLSGSVFQTTEQQSTLGNKFSDKQIGIMKEFNCQILNQNKFRTVFLPTGEGLSVSIKL